ncbi:streptomycin biosynthesis protein [Streptomyces sp. WAC05858]|nr:streptomycin biosynthesis protein [Streptomyces sp. WAC05858]
MSTETAATHSPAGFRADRVPGHRQGGQAPEWPGPPLSEVQEVPIGLLRPADSPRSEGINSRHVRLLAESDTALPPIVVHRGTMRIIDGMHRWQAAVLRGEDNVTVRYFEGSEQDAFALAVKENTTHGLPLSAEERSAAAQRLLGSHPQWSDRAIAAVAGVSTKTICSLRRDTKPATAVYRVGRDGRARPVSSADGRLRAREMMEKNPQASLRTVAREAGVSPSTVRDVRERLRRGEHVVPQNQRPESGHRVDPPSATLPAKPADQSAARAWSLSKDPALRFTEDGRCLLRLLMLHRFPAQRREELIASVPPHAATAVSEAARECARAWNAFADRLSARHGEPSRGERR